MTTRKNLAPLLPIGSQPCPPGSSYPQSSGVVMHPLPAGLKTMPNPCKGVPSNPWCKKAKAKKKKVHRRRHHKARHPDVDRRVAA